MEGLAHYGGPLTEEMDFVRDHLSHFFIQEIAGG